MSKHHFRPSARLLAQTATIVLVASLAGACSGGVERFDDPIFTGNTDNQRALLNGKPGRSAGLRRPGCGPRSRPLRAAFGASSRLRSEQHCLDRVDPQPEAGRVSSGEVRCACVNRAEPAAGEAGRDDAGAKRFGGRGAAHRSRLDDRWRNAGVGPRRGYGQEHVASLRHSALRARRHQRCQRGCGVPRRSARDDPDVCSWGAQHRKDGGKSARDPAARRRLARRDRFHSGGDPCGRKRSGAAAQAGAPGHRWPRFRRRCRSAPSQAVTNAHPKRKPTLSSVRSQPTTAPKAPTVQNASVREAPEAAPTRPIQVKAEQGTPETRRFRWPAKGRIISDYGSKPGGSRNDGINLALPEGADIKAAEDGTVIYSGNELKGYGNLVLVRHDDGWVSAYAHASELLVKRGDQVRRGQTIAKVGATGSVTQPQLHFELRRGNKAVDPMKYLASL